MNRTTLVEPARAILVGDVAEHAAGADRGQLPVVADQYRPTSGNGSEAALTDCAEVFTSRLAAELGLPASTAGGLLSRWWADALEEGYTLEAVQQVLEQVLLQHRQERRRGVDGVSPSTSERRSSRGSHEVGV